jgi:hypothetical protein
VVAEHADHVITAVQTAALHHHAAQPYANHVVNLAITVVEI